MGSQESADSCRVSQEALCVSVSAKDQHSPPRQSRLSQGARECGKLNLAFVNVSLAIQAD